MSPDFRGLLDSKPNLRHWRKQTKSEFLLIKSFSVFTSFKLAFSFDVTKNQLIKSLKIRFISSLSLFLHRADQLFWRQAISQEAQWRQMHSINTCCITWNVTSLRAHTCWQHSSFRRMVASVASRCKTFSDLTDPDLNFKPSAPQTN